MLPDSVLAFIPARGGSKGVPGKNLKPLNGLPLILHTTEFARQIVLSQNICVSTDDPAIKKTVENSGLPVNFLRPQELASDSSPTQDAIIHALDYYRAQGKEYDTIILLQPTSPFRKKDHLIEAYNKFVNTPNVEMVVSVCETASNPYFVLFEENKSGYLEKCKIGNYTRRQDCPKVYEYNGSIYVMRVSALRLRPSYMFERVIKYQMEEKYSVDIDTELDFEFAELVAKKIQEVE